MRIAIIGGGASGLITAWLLQHEHQVEVFEKSSILGGHIRTLNRNVHCPGLPEGVCIENGVLGFHRQSYPNFIRLMEKLKVPLLDDKPSARLYIGRSEYPVSPKTFLRSITVFNLLRKVTELVKLFRMNNAYKRFEASLEQLINDTPADAPTGPLLSANAELLAFQRAMLMLSFSTPIELVDVLPVGLTLPFLASLKHRDWSYVKGGVYHYLEILLSDFRGVVHLNTSVDHVSRSAQNVELHFTEGPIRVFDKVVFATSPGKILGLIQHPTDVEQRCFSPWHDRYFETIAHTDMGVYDDFDAVTRTPMDFFVDQKNQKAGYNTSMNQSYRLPESPGYAFAFHLDDRIAQGKVIDRQMHVVPGYTGDAFRTRDEIKRTQGENHCYYVGAWLGNGLHEGAVSSAVEVSLKLGAEF